MSIETPSNPDALLESVLRGLRTATPADDFEQRTLHAVRERGRAAQATAQAENDSTGFAGRLRARAFFDRTPDRAGRLQRAGMLLAAAALLIVAAVPFAPRRGVTAPTPQSAATANSAASVAGLRTSPQHASGSPAVVPMQAQASFSSRVQAPAPNVARALAHTEAQSITDPLAALALAETAAPSKATPASTLTRDEWMMREMARRGEYVNLADNARAALRPEARPDLAAALGRGALAALRTSTGPEAEAQSDAGPSGQTISDDAESSDSVDAARPVDDNAPHEPQPQPAAPTEESIHVQP